MRRVLASAVAAVVVGGLSLPLAPVAGADSPYHVIVHPQVKGNQIPKSALSSIFLKQAPTWGDGSRVLPVDQSVRSDVRRYFSNDVFAKGIVEVQVYWQRKMAAGVTPPPVKPSDEEVVSFVASTPGSIGYVSAETPLPASVKVVAVIE